MLRSQSTEPLVEPPVESPVELPVEQSLTVFEGSSAEDVSHARRLWSSLSLLPPQESRLVSADVRQRLPVSRPRQQRGTAGSAVPEPHFLITAREKQRRDERRRYEAMAENRRQILRLLNKRREQRIRKEALTFKPKPKEEPEEPDQNRDRAKCERDRDLVLQLP